MGEGDALRTSPAQRGRVVRFDLARNEVYAVAKGPQIVFDDLVDESGVPSLEIVIETPDAGGTRITEAMIRFGMVKRIFDEGPRSETAAARTIDTVFPKLRENPFIKRDQEDK